MEQEQEPQVHCISFDKYVDNLDEIFGRHQLSDLKGKLLEMVRTNGFEVVFTTLKGVVKEEYERTLRDWEYLQALMAGKVTMEQSGEKVVTQQEEVKVVNIVTEQPQETSVPIEQSQAEAEAPVQEETTKHVEITAQRTSAKKVLRKKAH
jgi:hypothetical protein